MKKLVSIIILCLGCIGFLGAQNVWKPINVSAGLLGAAPDGSLYFNCGYSGIGRSQDEGETYQIVLGYETGNDYYFNEYCFSVSPEGRIFVFEDNPFKAWYSDDYGDTWQYTSDIPLSAGDKAWNLYALNNHIIVGSTEYGSVFWTTDGGTTWGVNDTFTSFEDYSISDILANENGDVYVGLYYYGNGLYHSTLSDMQNWELVAFEGLGIRDMEFDPEGNVVCAGYGNDFSGFENIPGFYALAANYISISDNGIVYTINYHDDDFTEGLSYSLNHGEHFTEIGERMFGSRPLPNCCVPMKWLIKGFDNHLYYIGVDHNYKSVRNANSILENFPLENTAWVQFYRSMYEDSTYYQLGIKGDTVVNETAYKKVINCAHLGYPIEGECFGGIREDEDGKCYFMSFVHAIDAPWPLHYDCEANTEYPLYDFSLSICDVFQTIGLTPHVVFDTTAMQLNGSTRKVLWFDNNCDNGNYYDYQWIEGIGSTHSLLYPIQYEPDNGPEYRLVEVWQDEEMIYRNPHFDDYVPMIKEGNQRQKWNVVVIGSMNYPNDYHTEIQSIRDDITLDGVDYKIVWTKSKYGIAKAGAVREEDRRVYYRRKISQNYQDEVLLYDFNLNVGDTVTVNWMGQQLMVMEESEVEVNGTMRRQLGLGAYSIGYPPTEIDEYWIEGVGSTFGFLNSGSEGMGGAFITLLCYHENGNLVWDNEEFDDCVMNSDGAPATFAPQGAEWYFDVFNPWGTHPEYQRFFVEGDTIIQGHQCSIIDQRFVDTGHDGGEYVYEEDNKVYWFNPTSNAFTTLYDFDAEAGESWDYEVGDCTHQVIVDSVGSATWNGHTYRTQWVRFYEENLPIYYSGKIMEGIGYERGLFPSVYVCNGWEIFDASEIEYLRCYVNDGEMLYHEGGYDCEQTTVTPPSHPEWYYEILNDDGTITYQYMYQAGDTIINDEPTQILVKINTLYDKGLRDEVTHEYVFELNGKLYWWNKRTHSFTVLYDYEAEVGDSWNIMVGIEPPLTMTVDAVDYVEYEGRTYRVMHVSDPDDLFSGDIVCGIGHLTSFFPERLMRNADGFRVEGLRCYWVEDELVFNLDGEEECDAILSDIHGIEEDGPSTPSTCSGAVTVYPNPTDGVLFVETQNFTSLPDQTYRISNIMGQTLLTGQITAETQQIDVTALPEGMYFITFAGETRKFVLR